MKKNMSEKLIDYQKIQEILFEQKFIAKNNTIRFFKTGIGEYAQNDQFMGISVPNLRKIAKKFIFLSF